MKRIIFHIDVNSAYLSWEAAYRMKQDEELDLRSIPSIVGGDEEKRHGIVLAKSIPAKKYGILTGESLYLAKQKCPNLTIVPPNYTRYLRYSNQMMNMLDEYSPFIQQYSIDEAFLDYTFKENEDYMEVALEIKERIKMDLGFTVNIGIGSNKLLAKMASDFKKPDMIHTLFKEDIKTKMWPLPVRDLFMVGRRTEEKLNSRGIFTIAELANLDRDYVLSWLKKPGLLIWDYANGIDDSIVRITSPLIKSLSNSTTTPKDIDNRVEAYLVLLGISEMLGMRIRGLNMYGGVISISIRDNNFYGYSRQTTLYMPTNCTDIIYNVSKDLFGTLWKGTPLRQFSICISDLIPDNLLQLSMLENHNEKKEKLDRTIDSIRNRFGYRSVIRSCFLNSGIDPIIGGVIQEENYPMMSSKF